MSVGILIQTTYHRQLTSNYSNHWEDLKEKISTIFSNVIDCFKYYFGRIRDNIIIHYWDIKENSETKNPKVLDFIYGFFDFASKLFGPPNLEECKLVLNRISNHLNDSDIDKIIIRNLDKAQLTLINLAITYNLEEWNKEAEENFNFPTEDKMNYYEPVSRARFVDIATAYLIYATKISKLNQEDKKFLFGIILVLINKLSNVKDGPTKIQFEFAVLTITYSYLQHINDDETIKTIHKKFEGTPQQDLLEYRDFRKLIKTSEDYLEWKCGMILGPKLLKECSKHLRGYEDQEEAQVDFIRVSARALQLLLFEREESIYNNDVTGFNYCDDEIINYYINLPKTYENPPQDYLGHKKYYYIPDNSTNKWTNKLAKVATIILIHGIESNHSKISNTAYKMFKKLAFTSRNHEMIETLTNRKIINNNIKYFDQHIASIAKAYSYSNLFKKDDKENDIKNILSNAQMKIFSSTYRLLPSPVFNIHRRK